MGGNDFAPVAQMLMFTDAIRQIPVSVEISTDTVVENQEVFTLTLTNDDPMDVMLANSTVEVSITDTSSGIYIVEGIERNVSVQRALDVTKDGTKTMKCFRFK